MKYKYHLMIILAACLLGSIGIFTRIVSSENVPPIYNSTMRIIFSLIVNLFVIKLVLNKRDLQIRKSFLKEWRKLLIAGIFGFGLMSVAFTVSVERTNIANTFFLLYTAPFFVMIFLIIKNRELPSFRNLLSLIIVPFGIYLLLGSGLSLQGDILGNIAGLFTGVSYAIYIYLSSIIQGKEISSNSMTIITQIVGAVSLFLLAIIFEGFSFQWLSLGVILVSLITGGIVGLSYYLLNIGLSRVESFPASVMLLFEPVSALVYGFVFYGEILNYDQLLGIVLLLIGTLIIIKK